MKIVNNNKPTVVIFGRTNVGKSTLFNCLTEKKAALVADIEGTTRDSNIGKIEWRGKKFNLIDTGGIMDMENLSLSLKKLKKISPDKKSIQDETKQIEKEVQLQARDYLSKADLILFLVDARVGVLPPDKEMALLLKKNIENKGKILVIANKADSPRLRKDIAEFNKLSLGEPIPVSATTGSGTGDLLDIIIEKTKNFQKKKRKETSENLIDKNIARPEPSAGSDSGSHAGEKISVCIIGKPNVGKSSLLNAVLGEKRVIVSPIPHTTREPQDTLVNYVGYDIKLIDTAGISKSGKKSIRNKAKSANALERYGIGKSLSTLRKSDIAIFVIDIAEGLTQQDSKIIEEIIYNQNSLILVANKWDMIEERNTKKFTEIIYGKLPFATWAPIQFISAKNGEKVNKILDLIVSIHKERRIQLSESQLDKLLKTSIKKHRPVKGKGTKYPYIYKLTQVKVDPPKFQLKIGAKDTLLHSYARFIENRIREKFSFSGTPIGIRVVKNKHVHGQHDLHKKHVSVSGR